MRATVHTHQIPAQTNGSSAITVIFAIVCERQITRRDRRNVPASRARTGSHNLARNSPRFRGTDFLRRGISRCRLVPGLTRFRLTRRSGKPRAETSLSVKLASMTPRRDIAVNREHLRRSDSRSGLTINVQCRFTDVSV